MSGITGFLAGAFLVLILLNGGAYLVETSGGRRQQAQGLGSLAFFASLVLVPAGGVAGLLVTRRLGRGARLPSPFVHVPPGNRLRRRRNAAIMKRSIGVTRTHVRVCTRIFVRLLQVRRHGGFTLRDQPSRGLTLRDTMILVAATALGLGLTRNLSPERYTLQFDPVGPGSERWGSPWTATDRAIWAVETLRSRYYYLMPLFATWTVMALALCVRAPRPRLARLMRQPGFIACISALSGFAVWAPSLLSQAIWSSSGGQPPQPWLAYNAATVVGSSWLILFVGSRWRSERSWIDRFGRFLGVVWLVPIPLSMLSALLA